GAERAARDPVAAAGLVVVAADGVALEVVAPALGDGRRILHLARAGPQHREHQREGEPRGAPGRTAASARGHVHLPPGSSGPIIFSGRTAASNASPLMTPSLSAASRSVRPLSWAVLATLAAVS